MFRLRFHAASGGAARCGRRIYAAAAALLLAACGSAEAPPDEGTAAAVSLASRAVDCRPQGSAEAWCLLGPPQVADRVHVSSQALSFDTLTAYRKLRTLNLDSGQTDLFLEVTQDGGETWVRRPAPAGMKRALDFVFESVDSGLGLWADDNGRTHLFRWRSAAGWQAAGALPGPAVELKQLRLLSLRTPERVQILGRGEGRIADEVTHESVDGGQSWTALPLVADRPDGPAADGRMLPPPFVTPAGTKGWSGEVCYLYGGLSTCTPYLELRRPAGQTLALPMPGLRLLGAAQWGDEILLVRGDFVAAPWLWSSSDAGLSWAARPLDFLGAPGNRIGRVNILAGPQGWWLTSNASRQLFHSTDAGQTWTRLALPGAAEEPGQSLGDAPFFEWQERAPHSPLGPARMMAPASSGLQYWSIDLGRSWTMQAPALPQDWSFQLAVAVSQALGRDPVLRGSSPQAPDASYPLFGTLSATPRAGLIWMAGSSYRPLWEAQWRFSRAAARDAFIPGCHQGSSVSELADGTLLAYNPLAYSISRDGGSTWQHSPRPGDFCAQSLQFLSEQEGWALPSSFPRQLHRTLDAGLSWQPVGQAVPDPQPLRMQRLPDGRFLVLTATALLSSQDEGGTWQRLPLPVAGVAQGSFARDMHFVDARWGWVVGAGGLILHTQDGGQTWTRQASPVQENFVRVAAFDRELVYVANEQGLRLVSRTGGQ